MERLPPRSSFHGMRIITRDELKAKMDRGDAFTLFEVLPKMYWRKHHLPSAKNLPPTEVVPVVTELVPDRDAEIVLYCWDHDCPTSGWAGTELESIGYTIAVFPLTMLNVSIGAMRTALRELKRGTRASAAMDFEALKSAVGFPNYYEEEARYRVSDGKSTKAN